MLMQDLGFRAPLPDEEARIHSRRTGRDAGRVRASEAAFRIPAAVLSGNPLISYSGMVPQSLLGLASIGAASLRAKPAWFLISPTWSIEEDAIAEGLRELAVLHRFDSPHHRLIFVCNTPEEVVMLRKYREAAFFYNKTANTSERIFKPLEDVRVEFDAIYNAQLVPWKRHELSLEIKKCAFLFYRDRSAQRSADAEATIMARHAAAPGHVFINPFDTAGEPVRLPSSDVNRHLNRASVGLCLSEKEGAMFVSTEYLLAGLPIVTTPSTGGRHVYHDEEYCWTVSPDPRSVADAVQALKAKGVPRAHIRERTLRRLEPDRARFLELINTILEECRSQRRLVKPWPFRKDVTMDWLVPSEAVAHAVYGVVDAFERKKEDVLLRRAWRRASHLMRKYLGD